MSHLGSARPAMLERPTLALRDGALHASTKHAEEVSRRHNAEDTPLVVDNRQAADRTTSHEIGGALERRVGFGHDDFRGHGFSDRVTGWLQQIAVREHAHNLAASEDDEVMDALSLHAFGRFLNRSRDANRLNGTFHQILESHAQPLQQGLCLPPYPQVHA
jgi:hypothetical protein